MPFCIVMPTFGGKGRALGGGGEEEKDVNEIW